MRVSPYTEDGTAYDATRWFINFSIHALSSLLLFMVDPFFSGGIRTLKSLHWVSFQQVRTDVHARNPWLPPPGPSVPAGISLDYLRCEKSNKILFFADSRGLHHLYSAAHHWGSGFHSSGGRGFFKVYIHHLAKHLSPNVSTSVRIFCPAESEHTTMGTWNGPQVTSQPDDGKFYEWFK